MVAWPGSFLACGEVACPGGKQVVKQNCPPLCSKERRRKGLGTTVPFRGMLLKDLNPPLGLLKAPPPGNKPHGSLGDTEESKLFLLLLCSAGDGSQDFVHATQAPPTSCIPASSRSTCVWGGGGEVEPLQSVPAYFLKSALNKFNTHCFKALSKGKVG